MENKLKHGVNKIREVLNIDESSIEFKDVFLSKSPREKFREYVSYIVFTDKLNLIRDLLEDLDMYIGESSLESTNGELTEVQITFIPYDGFEGFFNRVIAPYLEVKQKK